MIKLGSEMFVDLDKLEVYKKEGKRKVLWCRCRSKVQLIKFISKQLVTHEIEGDTIGMSELDVLFNKKTVEVEAFLYGDPNGPTKETR